MSRRMPASRERSPVDARSCRWCSTHCPSDGERMGGDVAASMVERSSLDRVEPSPCRRAVSACAATPLLPRRGAMLDRPRECSGFASLAHDWVSRAYGPRRRNGVEDGRSRIGSFRGGAGGGSPMIGPGPGNEGGITSPSSPKSVVLTCADRSGVKSMMFEAGAAGAGDAASIFMTTPQVWCGAERPSRTAASSVKSSRARTAATVAIPLGLLSLTRCNAASFDAQIASRKILRSRSNRARTSGLSRYLRNR